MTASDTESRIIIANRRNFLAAAAAAAVDAPRISLFMSSILPYTYAAVVAGTAPAEAAAQRRAHDIQ